MSARTSGVKNFVSTGDSLVRALPFSQVKSAKAKGAASRALVRVVCACLVEGAAGEFVPAMLAVLSVVVAGVAGGAELLIAPARGSTAASAAAAGSPAIDCEGESSTAAAAFALLLDSNSATRFSSCSTRSSSQRSRSVRPEEAGPDFSGRGLLGGCSLPWSSANE